MKIFTTFLIFFTSCFWEAHSCTSYLVTKGASKDGSTLISYAGDSHVRYGQLYFKPHAVWPEGSTQTIFDRSSNKPLGKVRLPHETYKVLGFMNEYQLSIGESTFGGRSELEDTTGIMDWGSIMFLTLQRAKTAREAIKVIAELVEEYGYFSSGESYSIADPNEAWIMEIIGKGVDYRTDSLTQKKYNANKGAVWVAIRIPDGYISAHANHARITTFPKEDGKKSISSKKLNTIFSKEVEVVYAHDVIDFARKKGYFSGKEDTFSFSDVYAPLDFSAARFCELRVWAFFNQVNAGMKTYWEYAKGDITQTRIPLYIKPDKKISARDLMEYKGNYLQGTDLDMSKDVGAGSESLPYRWRPMTWTYEGETYFHERTTATQQTAFSWVAQMRNWLPDPIGGVLWYGLDDANLSVHAPFYCGMSEVPFTYAEGNGNILVYSENSAFWTFNRVSQFIYLYYSRLIDDVRKKQGHLRDIYETFIPAVDAGALLLSKNNPEMLTPYLTHFSSSTANNLVQEWKAFGNFLLVKYLDGNVKQENEGKFLQNEYDFPLNPIHPNYPESWKKVIIENTGDRFLIPESKKE